MLSIVLIGDLEWWVDYKNLYDYTIRKTDLKKFSALPKTRLPLKRLQKTLKIQTVNQYNLQYQPLIVIIYLEIILLVKPHTDFGVY